MRSESETLQRAEGTGEERGGGRGGRHVLFVCEGLCVVQLTFWVDGVVVGGGLADTASAAIFAFVSAAISARIRNSIAAWDAAS